MQEEGLEVRDLRRAVAQTLKAKGAVTEGGRRSEDRAGEGSVEQQLRDLLSEVMERLRIMARTSVVAARMLANE